MDSFCQVFALGRKQLSVTVDRDVCQFSRERHIAVEFFQMSFLDPLSISNKFSSHIHCIRVTAEGSAAAVFKPNQTQLRHIVCIFGELAL